MPAIRKRKQSIVRNLSRRHELAVAAKFGVEPVEAIPPSCRPKTATLSGSLLAKLADLAVRTDSLKDFQRHLLRAWKCRLTDNLPPAKELGLQLSDVVIALHHLEKTENAEAARQESPRILRKTPVAKPHHPIKSSPGAVEPQDPPVHRLELKRSSKSAAGAKINAWASATKRRRKSSSSDSITTDLHTMIDFSEDEAIAKRSAKRAKSTASPRPTLTALPTPQVSPRLPTKRPLRTRTNSQKSPISGSSYNPRSSQTPDYVAPTLASIRRPRRGQSDDFDKRISRQEEHAFFFKMPKGQHYKKVDPTMITDVTAITDFDSLSYPVEVPGNKRGEFYEIANAEEMRALVEARKRTSSEYSSGSTEVSASPAPSDQQSPKQQEASRASTPLIPSIAKPKEVSSLLPSPEPSPVTMAAPVPLSPVPPSPVSQEIEIPAPPTAPPAHPVQPYTDLLGGTFSHLSKTMFAVNKAIIQSPVGQTFTFSERAQVSALTVDLLTAMQSARAEYEANVEKLLSAHDVQPSVQGQSQDVTTSAAVATEQQRPESSSHVRTLSGFKAPYGLPILS